ncbi:protein phosphatase 1J isoform X2 [Anolis carolinensis]|uniref:protein phosphatase 1J isoform X2 n=1 Tax=Anolis carolinensis TaxID=28377 RepID=UPI000462E03A|nr:PREDICTED: protein phosphatase 1J isoform X2 [Anolis carolinensis]|eukprot:XP_008108052.1 PREDICTED: protein phosphatase 1J isoform X2 [Anolis carolinensis]
MLSRVRSAMAQLVGGLGSSSQEAASASPPPPAPIAGSVPPAAAASSSSSSSAASSCKRDPAAPPRRGSFSRPGFLQLTAEELLQADDHSGRAVQSPRESRRRLPWSTGYAEVINAGKSQHNEDQACCEAVFVEKRRGPRTNPAPKETSGDLEEGSKGLCFYYWGLFDGHAGSGAAIMASKLLHFHIRDQLRDLVDILQDPSPPPICLQDGSRTFAAEPNKAPIAQEDVEVPNNALPRFHMEKDNQIEQERVTRQTSGGCCALAVVYLLGKFYVANAGDSRAIVIRNGEIIPMSREFTPETERQRLQFLGFLRPELLGNEFTHLEFPRRIQQKELGKKMLYRDQNMNGWAYKKIEEDDLKFPLIYGEGKKARMMATIGVTRGLGDHDLKVYSSNIHIKPFLSCIPDVRIYDLTQYEHCPDDVLVLGTDGLWDVTNNQEVANIVFDVLMRYEPNDLCRYTMVAQELVMKSRGILKDRGWRLANDKLGSGDDISVFVIPLGGPGNYT